MAPYELQIVGVLLEGVLCEQQAKEVSVVEFAGHPDSGCLGEAVEQVEGAAELGVHPFGFDEEEIAAGTKHGAETIGQTPLFHPSAGEAVSLLSNGSQQHGCPTDAVQQRYVEHNFGGFVTSHLQLEVGGVAGLAPDGFYPVLVEVEGIGQYHELICDFEEVGAADHGARSRAPELLVLFPYAVPQAVLAIPVDLPSLGLDYFAENDLLVENRFGDSGQQVVDVPFKTVPAKLFDVFGPKEHEATAA